MDIIESVLQLPDQCEQAWNEAIELKVPKDWNIQNILVCGMGGSGLGAHVLQVSGSLKVPLLINNNYFLPGFAGSNTLVVLASYSGNTEEVLSCAKSAKVQNCKIIGVTSGGKLGDWLSQNNCPAYHFEPKFNTTGQPRMGVGYTMLGIAAILHNLNLLNEKLTPSIARTAILSLKENTGEIQKEAQVFAEKLKDKLPIIFASDYLVGNAHIFANQLNETAKTFSAYFAVPEANHHLLEGLKHPEFRSVAIFLGSKHPENIIKRFEITKEILEKNGWTVEWPRLRQTDPFAQSLEILFFTSLVTGYLGLEYGEDPLAIPTVDYFKEKLI